MKPRTVSQTNFTTRFKEGFNFATNLLWNESRRMFLNKIEGKSWKLDSSSQLPLNWRLDVRIIKKKFSNEWIMNFCIVCFILTKRAEGVTSNLYSFALYIDGVLFIRFYEMRWFSIFCQCVESIQFYSLQCDLFMPIDILCLGLNVALIVYNTLVAILQTTWYSYWSFVIENEIIRSLWMQINCDH